MSKLRIGLIGAGRMATVLGQGWIRAGLATPEALSAADPSAEARSRFSQATGARAVEDYRAVLDAADVLVLAVKPRDLPAAMASLRGGLREDLLVVSIAAGVPLAALVEGLGRDVRLARIMPNTPCLVGQGASGFCLAAGATDADRAMVERLFGAVGLAIEVDERLLDAVTGLSGSGPAFAYLVIEALSDGGVRSGLARDVATRLSAQTLRGAAEMVLATGQSPGELKEQVTSPGGTTVAGLAVLEAAEIRAALSAAVEAATRRSIELGTH
jgi:pyrroline-5-carboxylate reductase